MSIMALTVNHFINNRLRQFIENRFVQNIIIFLILVNGVVLGLETAPSIFNIYGDFLVKIDKAILAIFVIEIFIRITVYRGSFFRDPWGIFDLIVVGIALLPASGPFAVARSLRVLRVLRVISGVPAMRRVVEGLFKAIPGILSIGFVMIIVYYVFAVVATKLFGQSHPQWFGTIGLSMYSLFQIMTLESWSMGIVRPVMTVHPYAWMFFVVYILIATFTLLNFFIGIIVSAMQSTQESELDDISKKEMEILSKMKEMQSDMSEIKKMLKNK